MSGAGNLIVPRQSPRSFWRGRRVLVTGHTGFKGAWLALLLQHLGAEVSGIALAPEPGPTLFDALAPWPGLDHHLLDITNRAAVLEAVRDIRPDTVFHLAAQAIVRRSWREPAATFEVNVSGTIHLLDALRDMAGTPGGQPVQAAVLVTSDKVYRNDYRAETARAFLEDDPLGGVDPYSASKAAAEIAVASWRASFGDALPPLATARAGNVIGGGDFGEARLLPDVVRAQLAGRSLEIRHPEATRPWQHVLDALAGYLRLAQALAESPAQTPAAFNFGPSGANPPTVRDLLGLYGQAGGERIDWFCPDDRGLPEAPHLALDATRAATCLGWRTRYTLAEAVGDTARWYRQWRRGDVPVRRFSLDSIEASPALAEDFL